MLVSGSAIGYYGAHGDEPIDEDAPAGSDFLAQTCQAWEAEARARPRLGMRVVKVRTGVVLDRDGGALAKMLPPFRLGVGGPVAGGRQYISWIHPRRPRGDRARRDRRRALVGTDQRDRTRAAAQQRLLTKRSAARCTAPRCCRCPARRCELLYGEMAEIVTTGARVLPAKALVLGYEFRYPKLEEALRAALG